MQFIVPAIFSVAIAVILMLIKNSNTNVKKTTIYKWLSLSALIATGVLYLVLS